MPGKGIDKKALSERDICTRYITPAIVRAGWDLERDIREDVPFTDGRVIVRGKHHTREPQKRADYILSYQNIRLAIVEAKKNDLPLGHGMKQTLAYAEMLQVPFVFSSNGDGFLFHDLTRTEPLVQRELTLDEFPSPEALLRRYQEQLGLTDAQLSIVTQNPYSEGSGKEPRYYQVNAITRTLEAIARGQQRILLVMATGTGKMLTAFQIIWRLWKSKTKKRILFLADRNILVDQAMAEPFKPFGGAMTKIGNHQIDKSYEIYLSLYQAITGTEEEHNIYKQFPSDFFDLVIIDECHRGSASKTSAWRQILDYFSNATHIGLTATPKETRDVSSIDYFCKPVYTYSLQQGIDDGFLAPYKIVRLDLGWRTEERVYDIRDFDRTVVVRDHTRMMAKKITEYLRGTGRHDKTIVFCENVNHADDMCKALADENKDLMAQNPWYAMRITGNDEMAKQGLASFVRPESAYPVIVTTSKLLTIGVDTTTCKLVVIAKRVRSMTELQHIISRGTRIYVDEANEVCSEKLSFTVMDFQGATELFADESYGVPLESLYEPRKGEPVVPPEDREGPNSRKSADEGEPHSTAIPLESTEAAYSGVRRVGQDKFREDLLDHWGERCAITGLGIPELLRASHIKRWEACTTAAERLDVFNGLLLAPHLDAAFDGGFITVADDGAVVVSDALPSDARHTLGLDVSLRVRELHDGHRVYLAWHREIRFEHWLKKTSVRGHSS